MYSTRSCMNAGNPKEPKMNATTHIPATQNESWGFWGSMNEQATHRWKGWTIGRQTSRDYGIPRGLPDLTGFVIHCEIVKDSLAA